MNFTHLGYNPKTNEIAEWIDSWYGPVLILEDIPKTESNKCITEFNVIFCDDKRFSDWIKIGEL